MRRESVGTTGHNRGPGAAIPQPARRVLIQSIVIDGTRWPSSPVDQSGKSKTPSMIWSGYVGGPGAAAYLPAVDAEDRLGGVPVDRVGVVVGHVQSQPGRLEVVHQDRVPQLLQPHADLGRPVVQGVAEDLDHADLAAALGLVLEADQPHAPPSSAGTGPCGSGSRGVPRPPGSPRSAAAPPGPAGRRRSPADPPCCRPVRRSSHSASPTPAAGWGARRDTRAGGRRAGRGPGTSPRSGRTRPSRLASSTPAGSAAANAPCRARHRRSRRAPGDSPDATSLPPEQQRRERA